MWERIRSGARYYTRRWYRPWWKWLIGVPLLVSPSSQPTPSLFAVVVATAIWVFVLTLLVRAVAWVVSGGAGEIGVRAKARQAVYRFGRWTKQLQLRRGS